MQQNQNVATAAHPRAAAERLPLREKIGYGVGDFGFNLYWANISAFLLIFYTDVMGLAAAAVGTMMLVTKLVDAVTDPLMGAIADRTRTRFGRFRPYMLYGALPLALTGVLTWTVPDLDGGGRLLWAYATFTLMMLAYTVLSMPYSALSGVMTADSQQRTTLISFRFIAAFAGTTLVNWLTLDLVRWLGRGDEPLGWQLTLGLYGAVAAVVFLVVFATTRERIEPPPQQRSAVRQDIADLLRNKPWRVLFVLALVIMVTIVMRSGTLVYYLKYHVDRPELTGLFLGCYSLALAAGAALTPVLTRFVDKRSAMIWLMVGVGLISCAMYFLPKEQIWTMLALNTLVGLLLGPKSPLAFSMYADCADYTEWKTGRRATAMTFAAATFSQKLGGAVASAAIAWMLAAMGYVANQAQSDASRLGIVLLLTVIPGVVALLAAWVMRAYPLDDAALARVQDELRARREAAA
ncbi:MFS transporter [Pseudoxanthomonas broegbernensis]|uniref:MFS transporter n=1 Tax=Pseudoxanthomonas broegbernensis TaxID=83619 RepID=A0A7V8K6K3_9GAMM|nr:MFS transporter [Pseudoxanthomonas broegbernensis]KAF1685675.1 MFS transporter [Pseudoxanthomonas broegbernensis]MBB6066015.1 GPH family glycoside/pentoside/hexuronide:cation symporter [Pseudoxanthomonas broegbernensis]